MLVTDVGDGFLSTTSQKVNIIMFLTSLKPWKNRLQYDNKIRANVEISHNRSAIVFLWFLVQFKLAISSVLKCWRNSVSSEIQDCFFYWVFTIENQNLKEVKDNFFIINRVWETEKASYEFGQPMKRGFEGPDSNGNADLLVGSNNR